jgi:hypothetical protein
MAYTSCELVRTSSPKSTGVDQAAESTAAQHVCRARSVEALRINTFGDAAVYYLEAAALGDLPGALRVCERNRLWQEAR